jgi:hypothetical protein
LGQLAFDRAGQSIILPPAPKPFRLIQTIQLRRNFTQQTESIFCDDPAVVRFVGQCLQSGDYSQRPALFAGLESAGFGSGFGLSGEASALDTLEIEALGEE